MRLNSPPVRRMVHIWRIGLTDVRWDDGDDTLSTDEMQGGHRLRDIVLRRSSVACIVQSDQCSYLCDRVNSPPGCGDPRYGWIPVAQRQHLERLHCH